MKITMFKTREPKKFNFKTRYYDAEAEERKRRLNRSMQSKDDYEYNTDAFKEEMQYRWDLHRDSKLGFNKNNTSVNRILLFLLLGAIAVGVYWLLNNYASITL